MASAQSHVDWQSSKKAVSERTRRMFNNSDMSDICFTCEGSNKIFYAHKYVLGTSSTVFHAMFYGPLAEKRSVLRLSDTDEKSLEEFLRFLYTDECTLTTDNVVSVMYLSKKYIVSSLSEQCVDFLEIQMEPENVLIILEQAICFDEKELELKCWKVVDWHIKQIVTLESFNNISQETLAALLKRNSLLIQEIKLFKAVMKWSNFQCSEKDLDLTIENRRSVLGEAVYDIRFLAMTAKAFSQHVVNSELLMSAEIEAIQAQFKGVESATLKWHLGIRKCEYDMLVFKRFDRFKADTWDYDGQPDCVSFSVDREALFHGVRLYGDVWGNKYDVTFKIEDAKVEGTYKSKPDKDDTPGFWVMLKMPVLIKANQFVKMSAIIIGPPSVFGLHIIAPNKINGVSVRFFDPDQPNGRSSRISGQFHKIMLSI